MAVVRFKQFWIVGGYIKDKIFKLTDSFIEDSTLSMTEIIHTMFVKGNLIYCGGEHHFIVVNGDDFTLLSMYA